MGLMKVVVGIGNPGRAYGETRHNMGFWVVERWAKEEGWKFKKCPFPALAARGRIGGTDVVMVKPQTFVNGTGKIGRPVLEAYEVELADLMVVCDDFNLECGRLRIRSKGSAGGHHGLESLIEHLGSQAFPRLRIGIGKPVEQEEAEYVLASVPRKERKLLEAAVRESIEALGCWVKYGVEAYMNRFNRKANGREEA